MLNSSFNALQALQAAVGEQVAGGVLVGGEGGRPVYWDSPQATPDGVGFSLPGASVQNTIDTTGHRGPSLMLI